MKKYIIAITAILLTTTLWSQQTISGTVSEETDKGQTRPLPFALVRWADTTAGTMTDSNGAFTIHHPQGYYKLVVSYPGLENDTIEVTTNNTASLHILLKPIIEVKEVEVTGETRSTVLSRFTPIKSTIMTEKELFKAACCNLSESFETNPSIDVTYSDAITGAKQIQMLGLSGIYTNLTAENLPGVRGLASSYGLGYLPGTWIESIQISKGVGSVVNGYESISGQINTELRKPDSRERVFANAYANSQGRYEGNLVLTHRLTGKLSTALMLHSNTQTQKLDRNNDGFLDMPFGYQLNAANRWKYSNQKTFETQLGVKALVEDRTGGQTSFTTQKESLPKGIFGANIKTERYEVWGKAGYVFPQQKYKSIGFMWSALSHKMNSFFGDKTYNARQQSFYANLIYQSVFGNTNHKYRTGISFLHDLYNEELSFSKFIQPDTIANTGRVENVPGAFFEYTWIMNRRWTMISGLRGDYHNLFGFFATPRLHMLYDKGDGTVLHFTAGRGQRTANIFAENIHLFATSRNFVLPNNWTTAKAYGLQPEVAWNAGVSYTSEVKFGRRYATIEADVFSTWFQNQVVVDLDNSARQALFYNLHGKSYSNNVQVQLTYEPVRRLETRIAYRFNDVRTQYTTGMQQRYLYSPHRFFINAGYKTNSKWMFDVTLTWFGPKRLPTTRENPESLRLPAHSPGYLVLHAQVTKTLGKRWDVYLGGENLLNVRQTQLIIDSQNPFGQYFDASMIWGPVQGRMFYVGARFRIKN